MAQKHTERVVTYITPELHGQLRREAFDNRVEVSKLVRGLIETHLERTPGWAAPEAVAKSTGPWSIVCEMREGHVRGVVCPGCGGSGPR